MSKNLEAAVAAELMGVEKALETVAIGKALNEAAYKGASGILPVGKHTVDVTVRIQGVITKGESFSQQIVEKAEPWSLLAIALSKLNGVTVESLVKEALAGGPEVAAIKEQANGAIKAIKGTTTTTCAGKVTAKLTVTAVETTEVK
jgi:hypothetical protein